MLGRVVPEKPMSKLQWLAVVDMLYDSTPYGPEMLRKWLDRHQEHLGEFEPWRTWAFQRWMERYDEAGARSRANPADAG